ncbi:hypothetical protein ACWATR_02235 [Nostoc sp. UIC 10890]
MNLSRGFYEFFPSLLLIIILQTKDLPDYRGAWLLIKITILVLTGENLTMCDRL